jgi:hypothetical protein
MSTPRNGLDEDLKGQDDKDCVCIRQTIPYIIIRKLTPKVTKWPKTGLQGAFLANFPGVEQ